MAILRRRVHWSSERHTFLICCDRTSSYILTHFCRVPDIYLTVPCIVLDNQNGDQLVQHVYRTILDTWASAVQMRCTGFEGKREGGIIITKNYKRTLSNQNLAVFSSFFLFKIRAWPEIETKHFDVIQQLFYLRFVDHFSKVPIHRTTIFVFFLQTCLCDLEQ